MHDSCVVKVGQRWRDNDRRKERRVVVKCLSFVNGTGFAVVEPEGGGLLSRVALDARGAIKRYRLLGDGEG